MSERSEQRLSLYMPLHAPGVEGQQNAIRLKNLLREAQWQLAAHGLRPTDARAMLKPLRSLQTNATFWRQKEGSLVVLASPASVRCFHLPHAVAEQVHVGRRFVVRPLLALLDQSRCYWLLAISQNSVRLFRGNAGGIGPVEVEGLPRDLKSTLNLDVSISGDQVHSATHEPLGKQAAVFHGQGGQVDTRKEELTEFFRAIDSALHDTLAATPAPLVVACVQYEFALYRKVNTFPELVHEGLTSNAEHLSLKEMHARAWQLVEPHLDQARHAAVARYIRSIANGNALPHLAEIVAAAQNGKIDTLFIARDAAAWGIYDPDKRTVEVHNERMPGDDDLLELVAVETLAHHGKVYSVPAEAMPSSGPASAIVRYSSLPV